jgi:23S rRNA (adenine2503-C2)-methyltransferase
MASIHDLQAVEQMRKAHRVDTQRIRQLRNAFYKKRRTAEVALAELPGECRAEFACSIEFHALRLESRHDSCRDGASKLVFRTAQGLLIESVILRMTSGRTALCVSTQVGCAANCDFCATGKMGIARNLTAAEILDQLVQANQLLAEERRAVRNLVFMGMGEPFHNEQPLYAAIDVLCDTRCFAMNPKRLLISTVGIPPAMLRCAQRYPQVRMAVSLHSARQDVRQRLMPIAQRYSLSELRSAIEQVAGGQRHPVMIEYLLLDGVNDGADDVEALVDYLQGVAVHINLIPYNPIAEAPHLAGTPAQRREAFSDQLKRAGFPVTTRYSLGADIAAACGQLVRERQGRSDVALPLV